MNRTAHLNNIFRLYISRIEENMGQDYLITTNNKKGKKNLNGGMGEKKEKKGKKLGGKESREEIKVKEEEKS